MSKEKELMYGWRWDGKDKKGVQTHAGDILFIRHKWWKLFDMMDYLYVLKFDKKHQSFSATKILSGGQTSGYFLKGCKIVDNIENKDSKLIKNLIRDSRFYYLTKDIRNDNK